MSQEALAMRRRLSIALWAAFTFAVLGLPASAIPAVWIAAMTLPVLFFVVFPCQGRVPFILGAPLALGLQIAAVMIAFAATGPLEDVLGPVRARVMAQFAKGGLDRTDAHDRPPLGLALRSLGILLAARLRGDHARSPFFDAVSGAPVVEPHVLTAEELRAVETARDGA